MATPSPPPVPGSRPGDVVLEDARAIKAFAHPARQLAAQLLFARRGGSMTATELAREAGTTPSAMSYHLRAMERHGVVQRAEPEGDERERPWRAAGDHVVVRSRTAAGGADPASRAALDVLLAGLLDRLGQSLGDLARRVADEPPEWRVGGLSPSLAHLTATEVTELQAELEEVVERYAARHGHREPGTRPVEVTVAVVPQAPRATPPERQRTPGVSRRSRG